MASTEKSIENEIKTYLETRRLQGDKVFFYKQFQSGATMQGLPDIIASIQGCFVGIEVKTPSGVVSPHQRIVAKLIIQAGGFSSFVIIHHNLLSGTQTIITIFKVF